MQNTELHTYLALAGNQRLPHLEEEIFADEEATTLYLNNLCREYDWYTCSFNNNACLAYRYSWWVLNDCWKAAEPTILADVEYTGLYACKVLCGRWPEAELRYTRAQHYSWANYIRKFGLSA